MESNKFSKWRRGRKVFAPTANDVSKVEKGTSRVHAKTKKFNGRMSVAGILAGIKSWRVLCSRL